MFALLTDLYRKNVTDEDLIAISKKIQASLDAADFNSVNILTGLANVRRMENRMIILVARVTKPHADKVFGRENFIYKVKTLIDTGNLSVTLEELGE